MPRQGGRAAQQPPAPDTTRSRRDSAPTATASSAHSTASRCASSTAYGTGRSSSETCGTQWGASAWVHAVASPVHASPARPAPPCRHPLQPCTAHLSQPLAPVHVPRPLLRPCVRRLGIPPPPPPSAPSSRPLPLLPRWWLLHRLPRRRAGQGGAGGAQHRAAQQLLP